MPIIARRDRHQHAMPRTHPHPKPPSAGLLSIILRALIMCVLTSLFFLCLTLATILLIHVFLAGRQLRRPRRARTPRSNINPDAFSGEDLSQLDEFSYCRRDGDLDDLDPECVICLDRFGDGARYRILPGCGHVFHLNCIDAWLVKAAVCPICRGSVRLNAAEAASSADQSGELLEALIVGSTLTGDSTGEAKEGFSHDYLTFLATSVCYSKSHDSGGCVTSSAVG